MAHTTSKRRAIPSVDVILQAVEPGPLPRPVVTNVIREVLAGIRRLEDVPSRDSILEKVKTALAEISLSRIQPVINGTGILIHTNLGRAPLGMREVEALTDVASRYNNLELDLATGRRGSRAVYLETLLAMLCQSQAATVVNNCAAALMLILRQFTADKPEVIISRGELIQIGGGFRIPEILEATGARLKEIGTTNQTSLKDYEKAISARTGLILKVHRSNFFMEGFVQSPATAEIAALAKKKRVPFAEDLGSGAVVPTEKMASMPHEPTPAEILKQGVSLVCFSGDKLLGGPQAGIIAGKGTWIRQLKKNPLFRAIRCDKLILTVLQATAEDYLHAGKPGSIKTAPETPPVLSMLHRDTSGLESRAQALVKELRKRHPSLGASVSEGTAQVGGGTAPAAELPSITVDLRPEKLTVSELASRLRRGCPPVVGQTSGGRFRINLRTVFPSQDKQLLEVLAGIQG